MVHIVAPETEPRSRLQTTERPPHDAAGLDLQALLAQRGLVAVPIKPNTDQIAAGTRAAGVSVAQAWQVYTAMLRVGEAGRAD